jgi:hypothetical protein
VVQAFVVQASRLPGEREGFACPDKAGETPAPQGLLHSSYFDATAHMQNMPIKKEYFRL